MGYQMIMCPELPVMNWKWHDQANHRLSVHNSNLPSGNSTYEDQAWQIWKLQVMCMNRWLRILQFPLQSLFSQAIPMTSRVFLMTGWEKKKSEPDLQMFPYSMLAPTHLKALQRHSGVTLKDSSKGKTSQWAALQTVHLVFHFCSEKWPDGQI